MPLPKIAVTIGDPAGIGPEIVGKALSDKKIHEICKPVVIGGTGVIPGFNKISKKFGLQSFEIKTNEIENLQTGRFSKFTGKASYDYILKAFELITQGQVKAVVTAPVSKEAMFLAGVHYPGQTELFADISGTKKYAMLMVAESLRAVMVTRHIPLSEVSKNLTIDNIKETALLAYDFISKKFRIKKPKIVICSLNPHGGEGGILGKEDRCFILPAVRFLKNIGLEVSGPCGSDSAWLKMSKNEFDLMVAMYHDQAMIGLKCLKPNKIVNVTIGLPFIRTSPGHGTAFDIAGKNIADPTSIKEAIKLAARLSS
ncbi:MAG: 4-hydroxythreonine-4-phosphate dehydrogenase PdxA [Elusimicrobia bacterium]|nr:4-hydroxythreonine-4-phosphate dehydrogenase PdxA [Candidatus Liberimonas magnetica]